MATVAKSTKEASKSKKTATKKTTSAKDFLMSKLDNTVNEKDVSLFRVEGASSDQSVFVRHPNMNGGFEINRITSSRFKSWFRINFCTGQDTKAITVKNAVSQLEDLAMFDPSFQKTKIFMRVGSHEGKVYLNLCNEAHEVVEVSEDGWNIIPEDKAPVLFVHGESMKALPSPMPRSVFMDDKKAVENAFGKLRAMVNTSDEDFYCVIGWLIAALNPSVECPILWMSAGKGRGKTTLTNCLKDLIDPDNAGALAPFEKEKDFRTAASSRYIIGLDNFSRLSDKWSNIFCRAVTGEGVVQRKLYSDTTPVDIRLRVPMIINGIDFKPGRSDLQDRCFPITLQKLNADNRRTKQELEKLFVEDHQLILSALLNAVSAALKNKDYKPSEKNVDVRMLDATLFIMKAADAKALPFNAEKFREILLEKKADVDATEKSKLFNDPLSSIIYDMALKEVKKAGSENAQNITVWSGSTSDLMKKIREVAKKQGTGAIKDIPASPRAFGRRLAADVVPLLKENDIVISSGRTSKQRYITITFTPSKEDYVLAHEAEAEDKQEGTDTIAAPLAVQVPIEAKALQESA